MKSIDNYLCSAALAVALLVSLAYSPAAAAQGPSSEVVSGAAAMLRDYERIRGALAADDGGPVGRPARELASRARTLQSAAPAPTARLLGEIRNAGSRLARISAGDLPAMRRAFGSLSAALLALIEAHRSLGRGWHVFVCPMTEGEGRWLQPTAELENPYMGQRMLQCGRPVEQSR
ncbi:MAG: DUF3347 domain-containing protein [Deltaproteobacteria bacterium]|nr:DUF3347 domain-containing protein [Deltaproteobacteria bacterium]